MFKWIIFKKKKEHEFSHGKMPPSQNVNYNLNNIDLSGTLDYDDADKHEETETEISDNLYRKDEHKEIRITKVSSLQKSLTDVNEEKDTNI